MCSLSHTSFLNVTERGSLAQLVCSVNKQCFNFDDGRLSRTTGSSMCMCDRHRQTVRGRNKTCVDVSQCKGDGRRWPPVPNQQHNSIKSNMQHATGDPHPAEVTPVGPRVSQPSNPDTLGCMVEVTYGVKRRATEAGSRTVACTVQCTPAPVCRVDVWKRPCHRHDADPTHACACSVKKHPALRPAQQTVE